MGFPCGSAGKESTCNEGDLGSIPGWEDPPEKGKDYPLQYPGLENSTDYIVLGVQRVGHNWATFTLSFIHQMPIASPPKAVTKKQCLQILTVIPWSKKHPLLSTTSIHHPNPRYLYDLISCTLSPLTPPCYISLLGIPWSCQNSFCIRAFLSVACLGSSFPKLNSQTLSPVLCDPLISFTSLLKHHHLNVTLNNCIRNCIYHPGPQDTPSPSLCCLFPCHLLLSSTS